jgi:hypothetical protein
MLNKTIIPPTAKVSKYDKNHPGPQKEEVSLPDDILTKLGMIIQVK